MTEYLSCSAKRKEQKKKKRARQTKKKGEALSRLCSIRLRVKKSRAAYFIFTPSHTLLLGRETIFYRRFTETYIIFHSRFNSTFRFTILRSVNLSILTQDEMHEIQSIIKEKSHQCEKKSVVHDALRTINRLCTDLDLEHQRLYFWIEAR